MGLVIVQRLGRDATPDAGDHVGYPIRHVLDTLTRARHVLDTPIRNRTWTRARMR